MYNEIRPGGLLQSGNRALGESIIHNSILRVGGGGGGGRSKIRRAGAALIRGDGPRRRSGWT